MPFVYIKSAITWISLEARDVVICERNPKCDEGSSTRETILSLRRLESLEFDSKSLFISLFSENEINMLMVIRLQKR